MKNCNENSTIGDGKYPELDAFLNILTQKKRHHQSPQNVNMDRLRQFQIALTGLIEAIKESCPDAKIEYKLNSELDIGTGTITIEASDIIIENTRLFAESIQIATNLEVYPLTNGNIKIGLTFEGIME